MIGKIVVGLLSTLCFNVISTEAAILVPLPTYNDSVSSDCLFYQPKAGFVTAVGISYVLQSSGPLYRCFQVDIQTVSRNGTVVGYSSRYYYFAPSDTNLTTRLFSEQVYLIENPSTAGEAEYFTFNNSKYSLAGAEAVVGDVPGSPSSLGSAVVLCPLSGPKEVLIMSKGKPPQDTVAGDLVSQLSDNGLQGVALNAIYQGSDCINKYYKQ